MLIKSSGLPSTSWTTWKGPTSYSLRFTCLVSSEPSFGEWRFVILFPGYSHNRHATVPPAKTYNEHEAVFPTTRPQIRYPAALPLLAAWLTPLRLRGGAAAREGRTPLPFQRRQIEQHAPAHLHHHEIIELRLLMVMNSSSCGFLATIARYSSKVM